MVRDGILIGIVGMFLRGALSLAPWIPTRPKDKNRIKKIAALKPGNTFCEIGCGEGGVAIAVAACYPQAQIEAIEINPLLYAITWMRVRFSSLSNIQVRWGNALDYDMSQIDVVYMFLMPAIIDGSIKQKLQTELSPGARVLSYTFPLESRTNSFAHTHDGKNQKIYERQTPH